jgi:hypothetical protein
MPSRWLQGQRCHRPGEQHAAGVFTLPQAGGDLAEAELLEVPKNDHLAVAVVERLECPLETLGLLVEHRLAQGRTDASHEVVRCLLERHLAPRVPPLAPVVVELVLDLVLGDPGEPCHQRGRVGLLELLNPLE